MAPKTRSAKTGSKENASNKAANKPANKIKAIKRKPLTDKTNSGSDENDIGETIVKQMLPQGANNNVNHKKINQLNTSLKILQDKKVTNGIEEKFGVYEFTYDPNDEPPPQKKKRKRITKKPAPKPKTYFFTQNYDKNLSKAIANLKVKMNKNASNIVKVSPVSVKAKRQLPEMRILNTQVNMEKSAEKINPVTFGVKPVLAENKEVECDIDYSPVQSPNPISDKPQTPVRNDENDILNLQDDITFFDDIPVASSSLNISKNSLASPWRVHIDLPNKTPVNMCLKPDMTPAFEGSFIDNETLSTKRHVYTNILSEPSEMISQRTINTPANSNVNWKQSSIMSFIKEVTVKNLKKKKLLTPIKNNSIFDNSIIDIDAITKLSYQTPNKEKTSDKSSSSEFFDDASQKNHNKSTPQKNNNNLIPEKNKTLLSSNFKDSTSQRKTEPFEIRPKENNSMSVETSPKSPQQNDIGNCFGFDDTNENDQENMPVKRIVNRKRIQALKPKSRAVLQELNQIGPSRANLPRVAKARGRDAEEINKIYDKMQSEETAVSQIVEKEKSVKNNSDVTDIEQGVNSGINGDDSQTVHLFEDVDVIHHLKPNRKSYGKAKKVTFHRSSNSDMEIQRLNESFDSDDDYREDKTFKIPTVKKANKKIAHKKKVQKLSKKEEEEFEAWAADFNSMCQNVDECPLVVE